MRAGEGLISLWPLVVIVVLVILSAFSITPTTKLIAEVPADFAALHVPGTTPDLATQYWQVARSVIQWKYNRSATLPEQAPADFIPLTHSGKLPTAMEQETRLIYWAKLREEWLRPDNWRTTYSFDLHWALRGVQNMTNEVLRFIHQS